MDTVLLRPLQYEAADRLVRIDETSTEGNRNLIPTVDHQLQATRTDLFEKVASHLRDDVTIYAAGEPSQVPARRVTPDLFSLIDARVYDGAAAAEIGFRVMLGAQPRNVVAAILLGIGAVASAIPAWRAATGDPVEALRTE